MGICILPEDLVTKIAAGEVVERPASVVKELVENSLDAQASKIEIVIQQGGKKSIAVSDNGTGMSREDAILALERHATSKIKNEEDLFRITTLGFRGEAIPSIASVSKMTLITKLSDQLEGTEISIEGGRIKGVKSIGCPKGTTVEVRDLFFNTPARLKFLKSQEAEMGHIMDIISRISLAYSSIHFRLIHQERILLNSPPAEDIRNRVGDIMGEEVAESLFPFETKGKIYSINGLLSKPEQSRSSQREIFTYVNNRWIKDRLINHAIIQAYGNLLEKGRYPIVILFLNCSSEEVDVNVHPTKTEVKFINPRDIHELIRNTFSITLNKTPWTKPSIPEIVPSKDKEIQQISSSAMPLSIPKIPGKEERKEFFYKLPFEKREEGFFSSLRIIGQLKNTYLILQSEEGLILVDQHAAHERLIYEKLTKQYEGLNIVVQPLLIPEKIELSFKEKTLLENYGEKFYEMGIELEPFGGNTFLVKAIPVLLVRMDVQAFIRNAIEELSLMDKSPKLEDVIKAIASVASCHTAIRANQPLKEEEIRTLLKDLDVFQIPHHCPHGRPFLKKISFKEIEKMFGRK